MLKLKNEQDLTTSHWRNLTVIVVLRKERAGQILAWIETLVSYPDVDSCLLACFYVIFFQKLISVHLEENNPHRQLGI